MERFVFPTICFDRIAAPFSTSTRNGPLEGANRNNWLLAPGSVVSDTANLMNCASRNLDTKQLFSIVLAAGAARRFRATKQLADYGGEPLVGRAMRLAEAVCAERSVLVTGSDWRRVHDACAPLKGFFVHNEAFQSGMGGSIACAVRAVAGAADAVLLLLADQPLITVSYLQQMVIAWNESDTRIVCSEFAGVIGPPAIFPARYFDELVSLKGDKGARDLLDAHQKQVTKLPCEAAATDIDIPDDLIELQS